MPGPPQRIMGRRGSRGSDPRCVGHVGFIRVWGSGIGTVRLMMFPGVFSICLSVATVTRHVLRVGWVTVLRCLCGL